MGRTHLDASLSCVGDDSLTQSACWLMLQADRFELQLVLLVPRITASNQPLEPWTSYSKLWFLNGQNTLLWVKATLLRHAMGPQRYQWPGNLEDIEDI
jgi:hypothetical protein